MLSTLRNNRKSVTLVLLACVMGVFMLSFGVNIHFSEIFQKNPNIALEINGEEISLRQFESRVSQVTEMYRQRNPENFEQLKQFLNLRQRVVDDLTTEKLMTAYINDLKLSAADTQIQTYLAKLPFFQRFGLNQETYTAFLQSQAMSGEQLEEELRLQLAQQQLHLALADFSALTPIELEKLYRASHTKYQFNYLEFDPALYRKDVKIDQTKLEEYFKENNKKYERPKSLKLTYLAFLAENYAGKVDVNEEDLRELYSETQSKYVEPKQFKYQEIVIPKAAKPSSELEKLVSSGSDNSNDKQAAEKTKSLVDKLKGGATFASAAKELGLSAEVHEFTRADQVPQHLHEVLDRMDKGRYSDSIESPRSFSVVLLEDVKEKRQKSFDEVRAAVDKEYREDRAPEYAKVSAENFLDRSLQGENSQRALLEFAQSEKLVAKSTPQLMFTNEDLPDAPGLIAAVKAFSKGQREVVRANNLTYVVEVLETKEPYIPELKDVLSVVQNDFTAEEADNLARKKAEELLKSAF